MTHNSEFDERDRDVDGSAAEESPDLDLEHLRVFSIDDEDDLDPGRDMDLAIPAKREASEVLAGLEKGERHDADYYGFSDLSAAELTMLNSRWHLIDAELRASVVREACETGLEDFSLHLLRFFLFASEDEDPQVRQLAVAALGYEADALAAERLLEVVQDDASDDIRSEAANSLGPYVTLSEWGDFTLELGKRLNQTLFELAEDEEESWHIRRRAAESAAGFGPNARVNRLVQRMYDEDELGLRASALYAAGRGNQRDWLEVAIEELGNDDVEIRREAARSAGMFGDVEALPGLSELARSDDDTGIRHVAIGAMGEIGGNGAIRILTRLIDGAPDDDADVIDDALIAASLALNPFMPGIDED